MADLRNQLAEIYVKVVADTKAAEKAATDLAKKSEDQAKRDEERAKAQRKAQEMVAKHGEKITKKQLEGALKKAGVDKLMSEKEIKALEDKAKRDQAAANKSRDVAKKKAKSIEIIEQHIQNKLLKFRDYSGRIDDEELKKIGARNAKKLQSYESFLKRASSEHYRYADQLDKRDMTTNVIENARRGFEKGILISRKWHKDENTMQRISRGVEIAGMAFHKMRSPVQMATARFQSMQRAGYALQSVIGVLAGSIGSLVGGLMTIIGVAGQASFALVAIGSSFASIGAGAIAARIALGGVGQAVSGLLDKQNSYNRSLRDAKRALRDLRFEVEEAALSEEEAALNLEKAREELARVQDLPPDTRARREAELQFQQAELAYRRAKARSKDAREDLKRGPMAGAGAQDPLRNLTKSQKAFARYLASLKPKMDQLKEAAASGFLPILQKSIETVVAKAFPTLETGLNTLGKAMGNASKSFADAFTTPENLKLLQEFFDSSRPLLETFGRAAGNALGGVLGILKAAQPITERFGKWVEKTSENFENWGKSEGLESFLTLAGDVASSLGGVMKSVFGGLKNILDATFPGGNVNAGAGGVMLKWLQAIADGFKAFTGNKEFAGWLQGATMNATTALSSIGVLLKPIMEMAAMPEIGQFWTILREAAEPIRKMLEDGAKAGPEFAALLVSLAKMLAQFSDSGALESFFNTLKAISDTVTAILIALKPVLDFIGRIHGAFLAVGLALIIARQVMMVLSGITATVFKTVGGMANVINNVAVKTQTAALRFAQLRKEGMTAAQAVNGVAMGFIKTARQAAATRRAALLVQMARDSGMAAGKLKTLEKQLDNIIMKQGIYSKSGMIANSKILSANPQVAGTSKMARFAGGRAAAGLAGGAMMVGSMGATGGSALTTGLGMASMVASFLPGPLGLISSAVLGIGSAISSGFDAATQAEKDRKAAEAQRKIEIQAKNAQITAENLAELKGTTGALVQGGAELGDVQGIIDAGVQGLKDAGTVTSDYEKVFGAIIQNGFAKAFAGTDEALKTGLLKEIVTTTKTKLFTSTEAAQLLAPIYEQAGGGKAGLKAVQDYVKEKGFSDTKVVTRYGSTKSELITEPDATSVLQGKQGLTDLDKVKNQLWDIVPEIQKAIDTTNRIGFVNKDDKNILKVLSDAGIDFSKVKMDRGYYTAESIMSALIAKSNQIDAAKQPFSLKNAFGANIPSATTMAPYKPGYIPAAPGSSIIDKTANTNSNAANVMAVAANTLANVANVAAKQPTYVIVDSTGKPKPNSNVNVLSFITSGVTPIPYSGVYP